ncbi:AbrB/MazE/SpoVT family DNA-binding domain-containing protein [Mesotoga sp. BH458_6_3_2_1]|jgi:bifunctional DNA-binding transcriptional regulator/antitoxin component of YhaV-PrlF toxin-antitoxin module|uniref:AbrB/MazE/SpoVT family DNA-binding domain-containing protein n=1 Tax=Mesotoga sp. BH458_6_3_2_1 TaxID=1437446 RepID=UPI000EF1A293|nr:AbrB/MazE/SpoVT family DNA-binding domain-containing protein [Mesotoga sp. BH458_6_3_2_1]RLL85698.1 AbrB family transcriptional regulator [Mesotoga sp. BH458_6_3_2_1]
MAKDTEKEKIEERKIIRVSDKRQVTIPLKYYELLGFGKEAECTLRENEIVIRPLQESLEEFSEEILAELISKGYSGEELLSKFREMRRKIRPAIDSMIKEADEIAEGNRKSLSLAEVFSEEGKK